MLFKKKITNTQANRVPAEFVMAGAKAVKEDAEYISDFSYEKAFNGSKILVIGDTDHRDAKIIGSIASSVDKMAASGVKKLLIEVPSDPEILTAFNALNSNGDASGIKYFLDKYSRNSRQLSKLMKEAHDNGIEVVPIDMPFKMQAQYEEKRLITERGIYMGERIAEQAHSTEGKILAFCGLAHLTNGEIPSVLKRAGLDYRSAAAFSSDQSTSLFVGTSFMKPGLCEYVESAGRKSDNTLVGLKGGYGLNIAIYFKWEDKQSESDNEKDASQLTLFSEINRDIYADFSDSVEPKAQLWESSNLKKISSAMEMFGTALNDFQKFYISMALNSYLNSTMKRGGGSIVDIKYDSKDMVFVVRVVDTFNYPYQKDADYGAMMRYREVTVGTLLSRYGLPKRVIEDKQTVAEAVESVKIKAKGKDGAYKLMYMALASKSGLGTIKSDSNGIYLEDSYGSKVISLGLEEIQQDNRSSAILASGKEVFEAAAKLENAVHGIANGFSKRQRHKIVETLLGDEVMKPTHFFLDGISNRLSSVYSELRPMDDTELANLEQKFIENASKLEDAFKAVRDKLPKSKSGPYFVRSMLRSENEVSNQKANENLEDLFDSCIGLLERKKEELQHEGLYN